VKLGDAIIFGTLGGHIEVELEKFHALHASVEFGFENVEKVTRALAWRFKWLRSYWIVDYGSCWLLK